MTKNFSIARAVRKFSKCANTKRDITYLVDYTANEYFDFIINQIKRLDINPAEIILIGPLENIREVNERLPFDVSYIDIDLATRVQYNKIIEPLIEKPPKVIVIADDDPKQVYNIEPLEPPTKSF